MEKQTQYPKHFTSKGLFKKILEDKNAFSAHLRSGGSLEQIKHLYDFVNPISFN